MSSTSITAAVFRAALVPLIFLIAGDVYGQTSNSVTILKGNCRLEIVSGFFPCDAKIVWMQHSNGRGSVGFFKDGSSFTVSGGSDRQPNPRDYFLSIDTFELSKGQEIGGIDRNMEGECHFRLNSSGSKFYFIRCIAYNRKTNTSYKLFLEKISHFERKAF